MIVNYKKITVESPKAFHALIDDVKHSLETGIDNKKLYDFFDAKGVRVFVGYGASGGYSVTVYRKHTPREFMKEWPESGKDLNWKMKRIGVIQSFNTRQAAEDKGFDIAFEQLEILLSED